jgi:hypothetical protein
MADGTCLIDDCGSEVAARGWCSKHWQRWRKYGDPHIVYPPSAGPQRPATERFWEKVDKATTPDGCWTWTAGSDEDGYGHFKVDGRTWRASRWIFNQTNDAPLADGEQVRHTCDNPPCVRPAHLIRGTSADNSRDMVSRARSARGARHGSQLHPDTVMRGTGNAAHKLTDDEVQEIRARYANGELQIPLAKEFGVTQVTVSLITRRKTWTHLE